MTTTQARAKDESQDSAHDHAVSWHAGHTPTSNAAKAPVTLDSMNAGMAMSKAEQQPQVGANKSDAWWIVPQPYKAAHVATFPEKLVDPCILAGTSRMASCADCTTTMKTTSWSETSEIPRDRACPPDGQYADEG